MDPPPPSRAPEAMADIIGQTERLLASLRDAAGQPLPGLDSTSVHSIDAMGDQAVRQASTSVVVLATASLGSIRVRHAMFSGLCAAATAGRRVRLLVGPQDAQTRAARARISALVDAGAVVRVAPRAHSVMAVVKDRDLALLRPLHHDAPALVIRIPALVDSLIGMADVLLNQGRDATMLPPPEGTESGLTGAQRRQVLTLLAVGVTDEPAARALRVSLRTYRRHVALLLEELGASSRFQAGMLAAERGWMDFRHEQPAPLRVPGRV